MVEQAVKRQRDFSGQAVTSRDFPLWAILRKEGRSIAWLADRTGYSRWHVYQVRRGQAAATGEFRRACAEVMGLPEACLFCALAFNY
ncbi:MAG: hypothetical protein ACUVX1_14405 [Chloroflexota bacterium]